jgi:YggT family protein
VNAILSLIYLILSIYAWLIVARAVLSWFPIRSGTVMYRIYSAIYDVTEPYLSIFRRFLPMPRAGNVAIDVSAIVALVVLFVVIRIIALL